jgi:hypothetical protein
MLHFKKKKKSAFINFYKGNKLQKNETEKFFMQSVFSFSFES